MGSCTYIKWLMFAVQLSVSNCFSAGVYDSSLQRSGFQNDYDKARDNARAYLSDFISKQLYDYTSSTRSDIDANLYRNENLQRKRETWNGLRKYTDAILSENGIKEKRNTTERIQRRMDNCYRRHPDGSLLLRQCLNDAIASG